MAPAGDTGLTGGEAQLRVGGFASRRADLRLAISRTVSTPKPAVVQPPVVASRLLAAAAAVLLAVAALLFGAVHPWAYWTIAGASLAVGTWIVYRAGIGRATLAGVLPIGLILIPVLLQAIPIPHSSLDAHAPNNRAAIEALEIGFATGDAHSLSIDPALTLTACAFLFGGALWVLTFARGLGGAIRPRDFAGALLWTAVAIALFALVQKATFNGKIYWFWESQFRASLNYFGPFVNRNHFAGWMLLATSLCAGHLLGLLTVVGRHLKPGWRERVLWIGTPEASHVTLTAVGVAVMATSLVWSLSRSGLAGAAVAFIILAIASMRRMASRARARMALLALLVLLSAVAAWKGLDTIAASYGDTRTLQWRFDLWRDSLPPLRAFYFLGSGLNTYGKLMLLYPQTDPMVHAQQAHNDYLQLAIEGGALVMLPWLAAGVLLVRRIRTAFTLPQDDHTWWIRMGAVAGLCGMALQEVSEFSLQIPGVALLFATLLAVALHRPAPPPEASGRGSHRRVQQRW